MNCRERGSHARGMYHTQYTSRMETARAKEEEGADTIKSSMKYGRKDRGHYKWEKSQTRPS